MIDRKKQILPVLLLVAVSFISASLTAAFTIKRDTRAQFEAIGGIVRDIMEALPEEEQTVLAALKKYTDKEKQSIASKEPANILLDYGYAPSDFSSSASVQKRYWFLSGGGCTAGILLIFFAVLSRHRGSRARIDELTDYLSKVNHGNAELLLRRKEDSFSRLQDEIYKTITMLNQTRDSAVKAKERFAENLANIAHQLKTPITALSLSVQMMEDAAMRLLAGRYADIRKDAHAADIHAEKYLGQMKRQLSRLAYLEEALLLLSRIDAGTLLLKHEPIDVFTVITLAADNLEEMFSQAGVSIDISESGEAEMIGDMEWTMEAIMNLLKNCMEHTHEGGTVHCSYAMNPLYAEIRIWDEGDGFAREDLPHLFERFYCGRNAKGSGIGIGLAFAKELIEMQNGIISAENIKGGGASFHVRFYSH